MNYQELKPSFARHETFGLRFSWLPKGYQAFVNGDGHKAFTDDYATVKLGVGKNMVSAIFYWLQASDVIGKFGNSFVVTDFGKAILGEHDPYLEDDVYHMLVSQGSGDLSLIHTRSED